MGCNSFPQVSRETRLDAQARAMASQTIENRTASRNRRERALENMSADELAAAYKRWLASLPLGDEVLGRGSFIAKSGRRMPCLYVMPPQLRHSSEADKARHRAAFRGDSSPPANRHWVRRMARMAGRAAMKAAH